MDIEGTVLSNPFKPHLVDRETGHLRMREAADFNNHHMPCATRPPMVDRNKNSKKLIGLQCDHFLIPTFFAHVADTTVREQCVESMTTQATRKYLYTTWIIKLPTGIQWRFTFINYVFVSAEVKFGPVYKRMRKASLEIRLEIGKRWGLWANLFCESDTSDWWKQWWRYDRKTKTFDFSNLCV